MYQNTNNNELQTSHNSTANIVKEPGSAYQAAPVHNYTLPDEVRQPCKGMNHGISGGYTLEDYLALPDNVRAELIDGELIYMEAPSTRHQDYLFEAASALRSYIRSKKGACKVMIAPLDVQLDRDDKTMVQPDIIVICSRDKLTEKRIYGPPDLCIEITSHSSRDLDRKTKLCKYRSAGVREYWIVDIEHRQVLCYFFEANSTPTIYSFETPVPVHIFLCEATVDFSKIETGIFYE